LTGIFALLLWANLSSVALLLGVAFAAQLEAVRAGAPEPTTGDPLSADSGEPSQRTAADRVPGEPTAPMPVLHR
jgi:uncharacterized BrkB/YihY/UPF0761 family membrane protein